jgi:hypothetical protein
VPLAARLKDQIAYFAVNDLAAEVSPDSALEDEAVLVFAGMPVHRSGQRVRLHRMFHKGETTA